MPVTYGATPTEINFVNSDTDMASGKLGVTAEAGTAYSDPNNTANKVRDLQLFGRIPTLSKGGIWTFDGTDLVALGVGSDGQVLTADSTQPEGVKWAAGGSGGGGTLGTANGGWSAADEIPGSPTAYDDEFNGTSLDTGKWTVHNLGTSTITEGNGDLVIAHPMHPGDDWTYITETLPSAPWTFVLKLHGLAYYPANYSYSGMILSDSSGKLISFHLGYNGGTILQVDYWNSSTSYNGDPFSVNGTWWQPVYFKVQDDATNLTFSVGAAGNAYIPIKVLSRTAFLASGPTLIGAGCGLNNPPGPASAAFDYIRRTA